MMKWYFKSYLMLCSFSKLKVIHQKYYYLCVHMGTPVFGTRCWSWPLLRHVLSRLQIQHVYPLLPYLPIFHFLTYPTATHFYSNLLWCKLTFLYLLILCYIMFNLKLYAGRTRHMHLFPCRQPELCWLPQTLWFLKFLFKSNNLCPYIYGTHLLLIMVIFKSV